MEIKWLVALAIVIAAAGIYARAMRRYSGAGWREIIWPWAQSRRSAILMWQTNKPDESTGKSAKSPDARTP